MLNFETPARATAVAGYIEDLIAQRGLQPGQRIATKPELQKEVGVARATINEAVRMLHDRGRVTTLAGPKGGVFVAHANPEIQLGRFLLAVGNDAKTVADAITLRDYLEALVVSDAVQYRTDRDVIELRAFIPRMAGAASDISLLLRTIWELHERIAAISPNLILQSTYCGLTRFISEHVKELSGPSGRDNDDFAQERIDIHRELIDAIESGDPSRLHPVLDRHQEAPPGGATSAS